MNNSFTIAYRFEITLQLCFFDGSKPKNNDELQPRLSNFFKNFDSNGGDDLCYQGGLDQRCVSDIWLLISGKAKIMPPRMSAGRPAAESLGGGTSVRVGRGGRGRRPREGNDERVDDLNGQGSDQGMGSNRGVEGVNGNIEGASGGAPDFSTIIAQQLQNLLPTMLAQSVHDMSGCSIDQKVKYTAGSFVGKALTWWNSQIRTLSREVASSGLSASMAEVAAMSESALRKRFRSSCESSPSVSPPDLPLRKRYRRTSELVEDSEDDDDEEDEEIDENVVYRREVYSVESDGLGLEEEKEDVPWVRFEVGQGSGSAPESERPERVSAFRQPTLTTWTGQRTWTSSSLPISPSPSNDPSTISSPMTPLIVPSPVATPAAIETEGFLTELGAQVQMQKGLISDHAVRLEELSPALFERYDRDIGELFARWGRLRRRFSLRGQTDAQRAALWHAISDV
ncbi:hypothetical protein Tco_1577980 [Tanacetum coccineum]